MFGSFREWPPPVSCLAGRASLSPLETAKLLPLQFELWRRCKFSLSHSSGLQSQDYKKSTRIKLLVNNAYRDKILSIIQMNCTIIKLLKMKKLIKWRKGPLMLGLLLPPPFRKTGSETSNAAHITKAPGVRSSWFSSWKGPMSSQDNLL